MINGNQVRKEHVFKWGSIYSIILKLVILKTYLHVFNISEKQLKKDILIEYLQSQAECHENNAKLWKLSIIEIFINKL